MRRGRQPQEDISRARIMVSPRFLYQASLMEKSYLAMQIWSCEDKLKGKTAHFRLPSASQKRACLSSLLLNRRTATCNIFVLYNNETKYYRWSFFYFRIFQHNPKAGLCLLWRTRKKKPFDVIYCVYKMKQSHWLVCVAKNCDWSRKITPLSNLTRASLLVGWKLTAKAELNCEIYKSYREYWKSQVTFYHQSSPVSRKA